MQIKVWRADGCKDAPVTYSADPREASKVISHGNGPPEPPPTNGPAPSDSHSMTPLPGYPIQAGTYCLKLSMFGFRF